RLTLSILAALLEDASHEDMSARLLSDSPHGARVSLPELIEPLNMIVRAVPRSLASERLQTVCQQLEIFGLHAVRLDLREDSARLGDALGEILRALALEVDLTPADAETRTQALVRVLASKQPPNLARQLGVTAETSETWALFRLLQRARDLYGRELFGPIIISMTRGAADVLSVLLLARWAGCADGLSIVPLFETLADLTAAPRILSD